MQDVETAVRELVDADIETIGKLINLSMSTLAEAYPINTYVSMMCPSLVRSAFELNTTAMCIATGAPRPIVQKALIDAITEMLTKYAEATSEDEE